MLKKIISRVARMRFVNQLFFINTVIILVALVITVTVSLNNLQVNYIDNEILYNYSALISLKDYLIEKEDYLIQSVKAGMASDISGDYPFAYLEVREPEGSLNTEDQRPQRLVLESYLDNRFAQDNHLTALSVYRATSNELMVISRSGQNSTEVETELAERLRLLMQDPSLAVSAQPSGPLEFKGRKPAYSLHMNIHDSQTFDTIAILQMDFEADGITQFLDHYYGGYKGGLLVLNGMGNVLYDSSGKWYGQAYPHREALEAAGSEVRIDGERFYLHREKIPHLDIHLYGLLSHQELSRNFFSTVRSLMIIFFFAFVVIFGTMFIINRARGRKITQIVQAMKKTGGGDLSSRIPIGPYENDLDEISLIYNETLEMLNTHINRAYVLELSQKQYQLQALQAQINPHFLYNTLESIRMSALLGKSDEAAEMTLILSKLLRNAVNKPPVCALSEELELCQIYLRLHEIRYSAYFSVNFSIDEGILDFCVPRYLLQPIIENYIKHGFDAQRTDNSIEITASRDGDGIRFVFSDNGFGIEAGRLERLRDALRQGSGRDDNGLGLSNINQRIRLLYGKQYGIEVNSLPDFGTTVILAIGALTEKELAKNVPGVDS